MNSSLRSALRILRHMCGCAAVAVLLLHGISMAAPGVGHDRQSELGSADAQLRADIQAEHQTCVPGQGQACCCGTPCSVAPLPAGRPLATLVSGSEASLAAPQIRSGIEPEGLRRPPKAAA